MKKKKSYEDWLKELRRKANYYPLLKKCNGQFNEEMLKAYYDAGFSPLDACNDMLTIT